MKKIVFCLSIVCVLLFMFIMNQSIEIASWDADQHPIATVYLSNDTQFKVELYPEEAPNTVNNFIYLAQSHYYDGTKINRIVPNYLIQAGDPIGNKKGFPGYYIKSECRYNGVNNRLKHKQGTLSMARSEAFNTEGSQFFILLQDDWQLDGKYAAFGRIIEGLEHVLDLGTWSIKEDYTPVNPVQIQTIKVENYEMVYEVPSVLSVQEVLAQDD